MASSAGEKQLSKLILWVRIADSKSSALKIDAGSCDDVADFIALIQQKISPSPLDAVSLAQIFLRDSKGVRIEPDLPPSVLKVGNSSRAPVLVDITSWEDDAASAVVDFDPDWRLEMQKSTPTSLPGVRNKGLAKFLSGPLPVRIPLQSFSLFTKAAVNYDFRPDDALMQTIFVEEARRSCQKVFSKVIHGLLDPPPVSQTEDSFHGFWDQIILAPLRYVSSETWCSYDRNSNRGSSTGKSRPDFIFRLKNVCVFRGEEKSPNEYLGLDAARKDLEDRMIWSYGNAPYLLAHGACGYHIRLFALLPPFTAKFTSSTRRNKRSKSSQEEMSAGCRCHLLDEFNTVSLSERLRLLRALLHISRILPMIADRCPTFAFPEFNLGIICRADGKVIKIGEDRVKKTYPPDVATVRISHLQALYKSIEAAQVPNTDKLLGVRDNSLYFGPIGQASQPSDESQLVVALKNVLEALVALHRIGIFHRDIRWANVLQDNSNDAAALRWFLIDFDDASSGGSRKNFSDKEVLSREEHAPEIFIKGRRHGCEVDIWSVGRLVLDSYCRHRVSDTLLEYARSQLCAKEHDARPTAEEALAFLTTHSASL